MKGFPVKNLLKRLEPDYSHNEEIKLNKLGFDNANIYFFYNYPPNLSCNNEIYFISPANRC